LFVIDFECNNSKIRKQNSQTWDPKTRYKYSPNTSNTALRPHIELRHVSLYTQLAKAYGWKIQLQGLMRSQSALTDNAASPANSQREDKFSQRSFHEHLVNFIVADDQVRKAQF
jgi:hypothetical protein